VPLVSLLAQLSIDAAREDPGPPLPAAYAERLETILGDPDQTLLVAEDDGRLLGTVGVIVVPNLSYRARPYAIIENVVVDASARRQGLASASWRKRCVSPPTRAATR
jgi:GNAT superfamily N-acetyltransferase